MKYNVGDKVYVLYKYAPNGLIFCIIKDVPNQDIHFYKLTMLDYYQNGNIYEGSTLNKEFIALELDGCNCTESYIVPFGEAAKVLYGF